MVACVGVRVGWIAFALLGACSRINPAYGVDEGAGDGSSEAGHDGTAPTTDDGKLDGVTLDGMTLDGSGEGSGDTGVTDPPGTDGATTDPTDPTVADTTSSGDGDGSTSAGDPLAEPDAVLVYAGPTFTGRIDHDGMIGYAGATDACIDVASENVIECSEAIVAVLGTGSPEERTVDFATFLGVVADTPVVSSSGTTITDQADQFFDGSLSATLWQAGVFPSQTHIWTGFDPDQIYGNCEDWTNETIDSFGGVGDDSYTFQWATSGNFSCATLLPIICACW